MQPRVRLEAGGSRGRSSPPDRGRDGASDKEIVFTSGVTESDDLAILGAARMYREKANHILTGQTEHRAVLTFRTFIKTCASRC